MRQAQNRQDTRMTRRRGGLFVCLLSAFIFLACSIFTVKKAHAGFCLVDTCCAAVTAVHVVTRADIVNEHNVLRQNIFGKSAGILTFPQKPTPPACQWRLQQHELWLITTYFEKYIQPAMMMMTEQLVSVQMEQMFVVGTFFDAKLQLETQLLFQKLEARAHKDYQPSFGMCEIGSSTRSLAASDLRSDMNLMTMNKRFMNRQLGTGWALGSTGPENERESKDISTTPTPYNRLGYFLKNTCDDNDLNKVTGNPKTGLVICKGDSPQNGWVNRDIDWNNTVMSPRTINIDFSVDTEPSDNSRVLEMSSYLYGHHIFSRPVASLLKIEKNQDNFLDSRSITAKRNVAQNSFNSIVALKTRGTDKGDFNSQNTSEAMRFYMEELGFPKDDKKTYHRYMFHKNDEKNEKGMDPEKDPISYYGQMEMLAKKLYERPEFYTMLYETPTNVKRKSAAMQAIKLMLDRDIFDSQLRAEAILSMILEVKVVEEQQAVENTLNLVKEQTR